MSEKSRVEGRHLKIKKHLELVQVDARTVGEAIAQMQEGGAGETELRAMKAALNAKSQSATARKWARTFNFFPGAATEHEAPALYVPDDDSTHGRFKQGNYPLDEGWGPVDRMVVRRKP